MLVLVTNGDQATVNFTPCVSHTINHEYTTAHQSVSVEQLCSHMRSHVMEALAMEMTCYTKLVNFKAQWMSIVWEEF